MRPAKRTQVSSRSSATSLTARGCRTSAGGIPARELVPAKRLIKHERLYRQIGESRRIFGGDPEFDLRPRRPVGSYRRGMAAPGHGAQQQADDHEVRLRWLSLRSSRSWNNSGPA
jgi:hypothetical protein